MMVRNVEKKKRNETKKNMTMMTRMVREIFLFLTKIIFLAGDSVGVVCETASERHAKNRASHLQYTRDSGQDCEHRIKRLTGQ